MNQGHMHDEIFCFFFSGLLNIMVVSILTHSLLSLSIFIILTNSNVFIVFFHLFLFLLSPLNLKCIHPSPAEHVLLLYTLDVSSYPKLAGIHHFTSRAVLSPKAPPK